MKITKRELKQMINESINEFLNLKRSQEISEGFTFGEAKKILIPLGWNVTYNGLNAKISKDVAGKKYTSAAHLKHDGRTPESRTIDVNQMDKLREQLVDDFLTNGDMNSFEAIKLIPWEKCGEGGKIKSPFKNLLKDYDPNTGKKKGNEVVLSRGQRGAQTRLKNLIAAANEKYEDAVLEPLDFENPEGAQLLAVYNELYRKYRYNTCRSPHDRRPLLKDWTYDIKKKNGSYYLGRDDGRVYKTFFYKVLSSGELDKTYSLKESMDMSVVSNLLAKTRKCNLRFANKRSKNSKML